MMQYLIVLITIGEGAKDIIQYLSFETLSKVYLDFA